MQLNLRDQLEAHSFEFRKEIIEVAEGIHVGVGYDGSNASMVVGDDGVIIIDALRAVGAADELAPLFRGISSKPVMAIIYTHGHPDHTGGASVFAGDDAPDVYARANFSPEHLSGSPVNRMAGVRGIRQFGRDIPDDEILNRGVGPGKTPTRGVSAGFLQPNRTFAGKELETTIAGMRLQLVAAPGETDDQLYVWLPDRKVLFCGDNCYNAFPNLYAIRGQYRDIKEWGESVAEMSRLGAHILVPGHTRPTMDPVLTQEKLENYSAAILSVYEQTIAGINRGMTPDQLAHAVQLPPGLAEKSYLKEFYGAVPWAVRSIFAGHLGWFDGNPASLFPLHPNEEADRFAELAGGMDKLVEHIQGAVDRRDYQWACQLADKVMVAGSTFAAEAKRLKIAALRGLSQQQINAPAMNYYLSCAIEMEAEERDRAQG